MPTIVVLIEGPFKGQFSPLFLKSFHRKMFAVKVMFFVFLLAFLLPSSFPSFGDVPSLPPFGWCCFLSPSYVWLLPSSSDLAWCCRFLPLSNFLSKVHNVNISVPSSIESKFAYFLSKVSQRKSGGWLCLPSPGAGCGFLLVLLGGAASPSVVLLLPLPFLLLWGLCLLGLLLVVLCFRVSPSPRMDGAAFSSPFLCVVLFLLITLK